MNDSDWAPVARGARQALDHLGYPVKPDCLPGDTDPCGATFAEHTVAYLATIKAVADHQLGHLGPLFAEEHGTIYWDIRAELEHNDEAGAKRS